MDFISEQPLEICSGMDNWGPYHFKVPISTSATANNGTIPFDTEIASVDVQVFQGIANKSSVMSDFTEITPLVLDSDRPADILDGDTIAIWFQYPGVGYKGRMTIVFTVTLDTGAVRPLYFSALNCK